MTSPAAVASVLDPTAYLAQLAAAAPAAGFRAETYGRVGALPLLALTHRTPGPRPRIYLSAGIHGDEPAPPLALLRLLERGAFDARAIWFLCPMLNPAGFAACRRENSSGLDLNRDYKAQRSAEIQAHARWLQRQPNFGLTLCLHEDWEAQGFYLYELNPGSTRSLASALIAAATRHCPLEPATVIDGRLIAEPGIIRPIADPSLRDPWPESIYLRAHHTQLAYTVETPSSLPLATRVAAMSAAVGAAIDGICGAASGSARAAD